MRIVASYKGNGNITHNVKTTCQGIYIDNYGAADMTFTIKGTTITVPTQEKFLDVFGNYSQVVFTGVDNYVAHFMKGDRYGKEVVVSYQGAINETVSLPSVCNGLAIINNGGSDMTINVNGVVISIPDGSKLNENFSDFNKIDVLAGGTYYLLWGRGDVRFEDNCFGLIIAFLTAGIEFAEYGRTITRAPSRPTYIVSNKYN